MAVLSNTGIRAGASGPGADPYIVKRSARFNDDDSAYLNKTFSSAGNRILWTFSTWIKRGDLTANNYIFDAIKKNPYHPIGVMGMISCSF